MLADVYTPVGIYLRLRDRFRDTILLESTDFHARRTVILLSASMQLLGLRSIQRVIEFKLPGQNAESMD